MTRDALLPGTLQMLILKSISRFGEMHGFEIAEAIQRESADVLTVEEGSLYPALQRLLVQGWVVAEWSTTAGNRRARYYRLTRAGRRQLGLDIAQFERVSGAIRRVLQTA
jgi:transcriptional regulator